MDTKMEPNITNINDSLAPAGLSIEIISANQVEFTPNNARYMRQETFQNLVNNIKRDGAITSLPYGIRTPDGKFLVLSGNHRLKAAIKAGLETFPVIINHKPLTKGEQIAIQLSHNAIAGEDDLRILKDLYDQIADVDLKYYSGLTDDDFNAFKPVDLESLTSVSPPFYTLSLIFFPAEAENVAGQLKRAGEAAKNFSAYAATLAEYDRLLDAPDKAERAYNVINTSTAFQVILNLFERNVNQLAEGRLVPIATVLGTDLIPVAVAQQLQRDIKKAGNPKSPELLLTIQEPLDNKGT